MPNRYEREIEEILRNLETTEPRAGRGQKFGERTRHKPPTRQRRQPMPSLNLRVTDWFLLIAVVTISIAAGFAYANAGANTITGIVALVGLVCLILLALSSFISYSRSSTQSTRYGNVTPLRRSPFHGIATRWHLFRLKLRYKRRNEH
ncbi:MAG TPA: hypothetical protein VKU38_16880 [Ktedonobacteraceae bacterium]|nr:hypothetical protein [Ktedonobacteraceae bacterium]